MKCCYLALRDIVSLFALSDTGCSLELNAVPIFKEGRFVISITTNILFQQGVHFGAQTFGIV